MQSKHFIFLTLSALIFSSCDTISRKSMIEKQENIFKKSIAYNDAGTALAAAYTILELDTTKLNYRDSLASLYFVSGNYPAAYELALISRDTASVLMKKILAYSAFKNGKYADASLHFQDLLKADKGNTIAYEYEIGVCFFNIENYETAMKQMQKVIENPVSRTAIKEIPSEGGIQKVPYYAAALNTAGFIYILSKQFDDAENIYSQLLKDYPGFILAENNYKYLVSAKKASEKK